jgi:hypothetical protein
MLTLTRYSGLELPVFEASRSLVFNPTVSMNLPPEDTKRGNFLRFVHLQTATEHKFPNLQKALETADQAFEAVASFCGAVVVQHEWGLYKKENLKGNQYNNGDRLTDPGFNPHILIPSGYLLCAEVDIVTPTNPRSETYDNNLRNLLGVAQRTPLGAMWRDARPDQFIIGETQRDPTDKLRLVDVEPVFS